MKDPIQYLDHLYRQDYRRVLATVIRLLRGDFDLAEDAVQKAFAAAMQQWPRDGIPDQPRAWLVSTARFSAIDQLRRRQRHDRASTDLLLALDSRTDTDPDEAPTIEDDRLRLIFICCHPALAREARIALTLREVCGLTTEQIAAAFLIPVPTLAQRIVRAKAKIRAAAIPYEVPVASELPARLDGVLQVIYLVFNEGYLASSGDATAQQALAQEAIRLTQLLYELLPSGEVLGLLALMQLHEARRAARFDDQGQLIPLEAQDRRRWDHATIRDAGGQVQTALRSGPAGPYVLQAAIAALHAEAPTAADTDWAEIVGLYQVLLTLQPTPVVRLNHAVAVAMRDGPAAGLRLLDALNAEGELTDYALLPAARADLLRRLDRLEEARVAYDQALTLTRSEQERAFLRRQRDDLIPSSANAPG